ncbi:MAG: hypothetical protein GXO24_04855 [Chlorobi bacterium]|nr:hypothetical protein [Chlorobiota bacterium]
METAIFVLILIFGYALMALFRAVFPDRRLKAFRLLHMQVNPVKLLLFVFLSGAALYFMFTAHWLGFFLAILLLTLLGITSQL